MRAEWTTSTLDFLLKLLSFVNLHLYPKCLHKHAYSIIILSRKWNNYISVFHRRLNKVIICRLHKLAVLCKYINNCATTLIDITLNTSGKSDVIGSEYKYFKVHKMAEPFFKNSMNSFKDNNRCSFYNLKLGSPLVCCEIIARNWAVLSTEQIINFFKSHIKVQRVWMVEVIEMSIFMVMFTTTSVSSRLMFVWLLTKVLCRMNQVKSKRCQCRIVRQFFYKVKSYHLRCRRLRRWIKASWLSQSLSQLINP